MPKKRDSLQKKLYLNSEQNKIIRIRHKIRLRGLREHAIFTFRERFKQQLHSNHNVVHKAALQFIADREEMPDYICCFCDNLFFKYSVFPFSVNGFSKKLESKQIATISNAITKNSGWVCRTCNRYITLGKVPKMAIVNGLAFQNVSPCLARLSALEERMVSPYINFMQIRPLKKCALNPQLGMKVASLTFLLILMK